MQIGSGPAELRLAHFRLSAWALCVPDKERPVAKHHFVVSEDSAQPGEALEASGRVVEGFSAGTIRKPQTGIDGLQRFEIDGNGHQGQMSTTKVCE